MVERSGMRSDAAGVARLGGVCSILIGILSGLAGLTYLFIPSDQRLGRTGETLLPSFADGGGVLRLELWELALIGFLGLAVVPALSRLVRPGGWIRWTGTIALLGFAVSAVSNLLTLERLPRVADAFVAGDASTRAALGAVWKASIDPWGVVAFGGVGLWVFVLGLLSLRGGSPLPPTLSYLGILFGVVYALVPVAVALRNRGLIVLAAVVAGAAAIVWYGWAGNVALRSASMAQMSPD